MKTMEDAQATAAVYMWAVVKSIKQRNGIGGFILRKNDIIKLGRLRFRVRELNTNQKIQKGIQPFIFSSQDKKNIIENPFITRCHTEET
jgi:hypothetical protein